jgi:hypothetical protein
VRVEFSTVGIGGDADFKKKGGAFSDDEEVASPF